MVILRDAIGSSRNFIMASQVAGNISGKDISPFWLSAMGFASMASRNVLRSARQDDGVIPAHLLLLIGLGADDNLEIGIA